MNNINYDDNLNFNVVVIDKMHITNTYEIKVKVINHLTARDCGESLPGVALLVLSDT